MNLRAFCRGRVCESNRAQIVKGVTDCALHTFRTARPRGLVRRQRCLRNRATPDRNDFSHVKDFHHARIDRGNCGATTEGEVVLVSRT